MFNEVFVYWFPNLGFSFCLLGVVVGLNWAGPRVAALAQLSFVALALGGVLCLSAIGLLGLGQAPSVVEATSLSSSVTFRGLLTGLLLFVGFELALFTPQHMTGATSHPGRLMAMRIVLAGLVFGVWGLVEVSVMRMPYLRTLGLVTLGLLVHLGHPGTLLAGDITAGRALYQQYCSTCHGPQGKGNGPAASALNPKPRDHTDGHYMNALSDAHLKQVISEGGAAVQRSPLMPPWKGTLTPQQIDDVMAYLRTLAVPPYKP